MFFEIEGRTFGVKFSRVGTRTFAELMVVKPNNGMEHTNIYGEVGLFYKDKFDARQGRKLALAVLLEKMQKKFNLTKVQRTSIWELYFKSNKK